MKPKEPQSITEDVYHRILQHASIMQATVTESQMDRIVSGIGKILTRVLEDSYCREVLYLATIPTIEKFHEDLGRQPIVLMIDPPNYRDTVKLVLSEDGRYYLVYRSSKTGSIARMTAWCWLPDEEKFKVVDTMFILEISFLGSSCYVRPIVAIESRTMGRMVAVKRDFTRYEQFEKPIFDEVLCFLDAMRGISVGNWRMPIF